MDLSPKLLTDVQFREQWRGYNPEEVDEFLERVAIGVGEMQQRLADALERASNAEHRLLERSDEDEIKRTLVLAQRTAVAAMEEARAEADRLVTETEARCQALVQDAEAQAARLDEEISTRRRTELGNLAEERAELQRDIERLRQYLEGERARLADAMRTQIDELGRLYALATEPAVSDVVVDRPREAAPPVTTVHTLEPIAVDEDEEPTEEGEDDWDVDDLRNAREELSEALQRLAADDDDDGDDAATTGDAEEDDDDPFLAELRRAVVDTEPLGPRDDEQGAIAGSDDAGGDDDGTDRGGFLHRRRRS